jgi:hypothetical protein
MPIEVKNNKRLFLKPEEVNPKEMKELKALRKEALSGDVSKKSLTENHLPIVDVL